MIMIWMSRGENISGQHPPIPVKAFSSNHPVTINYSWGFKMTGMFYSVPSGRFLSLSCIGVWVGQSCRIIILNLQQLAGLGLGWIPWPAINIQKNLD